MRACVSHANHDVARVCAVANQCIECTHVRCFHVHVHVCVCVCVFVMGDYTVL